MSDVISYLVRKRENQVQARYDECCGKLTYSGFNIQGCTYPIMVEMLSRI